jgi:dinuclear metal center YbgI/SA1388 family protein
MLQTDVVKHWQELLHTDEIKDYCPKGFVVEGKKEVHRILGGVSFSRELAEQAVEQNADMVLVHHPNGFWDNQPRLPLGWVGDSLRLLMKNDISLVSFHLPLDAHAEVGNNAQILKALGVKRAGGFWPEGKHFIGAWGDYDMPQKWIDFLAQVRSEVGKVNFAFTDGPVEIRRVAVCSGSAAKAVEYAAELGADVFVTGEAREDSRDMARELGIHFLALGHHRTEVFGVQALGRYSAERWALDFSFWDSGNPV